MLDLGRAFGFVIKDQNWFGKILLGGVISLIPLVGLLAVWGFFIQTAQNVKHGDPQPLPSWGDFGTHLLKGLYFLIISIVYAIPIAIILTPIICVAGIFFGENEASPMGIFMMFVFYAVAIPLTYGGQLLVQGALFRYVQTEQLGAALNIIGVFRAIRNDPHSYLLIFAVRLLTSVVALLGISIFGIGILFTTMYAEVIFGHALGQLAATQQVAPQPATSDQPAAYAQDPPPEYSARA